MKYKIEPADASGRGLSSERYTLTRHEDLTLCRISFLPYADEAGLHPDDQAHETYGVEFWAMDVATAYDELINTLQTFHNCGLTEFDSTDQPFESEKVLAWLDHYDALSQFSMIYGDSKLGQIRAALDFNEHVTYVLRKLCELVSQIKEQVSREAYFEMVAG